MPQKMFVHQPAQPTPKKSGDANFHLTLELADRDIIRIYNPLDIVVRYKWDGRTGRVNPGAYDDVYRFLANKFLNDITELEINKDYIEAGEAELLKRKSQGIEYIDPHQENRLVWDNFRIKFLGKQAKQKKQIEMAQKCIIGVVRYFNEGEEVDEAVINEQTQPVDEAIQDIMNRPIPQGAPSSVLDVITPQSIAHVPAVQGDAALRATTAKAKMAKEASV